MDRRDVLRRWERDLVRLCHAGHDSGRFRLEAQRQLRRLVPADAYFWATTDPATVLATSAVSAEIAEEAIPPLWANEFLDDDVNKFATLARAAGPVGHLYGSTGGQPDRSARHREIFAPLGLGDELRAALVAGGQCWGILCLNRARGGRPYGDEDVARLARLAPHLAAGLRAALLLDHVDAVPAEEGPRLIVLAEDLTVVATTAAAERWLAELQDWPRRRDLPNAVLVLVARLRGLEREGGPHVLARVRVRTPSGRWLLLHAARLAGAGGAGAIAIITEVARPAAIAPLILQAYGLTEREAQVARLVLRGAATREIAASLAVAAATVQQHLKAIFDKTGVRSRRELVAQIFGQQYAPRLAAGAAVGADGWFAPE